jgi:hypothetical protein
MKFLMITIFCWLYSWQLLQGQVYTLDSLPYAGTNAKERKQFSNKLYGYIQSLQQKPIDSIKTSEWSRGLWAMEFTQEQSNRTNAILQKALQHYNKLNKSTRQQLWQTVYAVGASNLVAAAKSAIAIDTVLKQQYAAWEFINKYEPNYKYTFLPKLDDSSLVNAKTFDSLNKKIKSESAQKNVIEKIVHPNYPIIISLQPHNRNKEGIALIKLPNNSFYKNADTIWWIPQLARSSNGLPWYISNGNTPQGVFAITGIATSTNSFIGRTPNLTLQMPNEGSVADFFHNQTLQKGNYIGQQQMADSFLFMNSYEPLWQSYFAGAAGRTEIIAHGTTVDIGLFTQQPYYPNTPTMGCLSCTEWYNAKGQCIKSNQLQLVNSFLNTGFTKGYLVVLNVDDNIIAAYSNTNSKKPTTK